MLGNSELIRMIPLQIFGKGELTCKISNHTLPHILLQFVSFTHLEFYVAGIYKMKAITIFSEVNRRQHKPIPSTAVNWYKRVENRNFMWWIKSRQTTQCTTQVPEALCFTILAEFWIQRCRTIFTSWPCVIWTLWIAKAK